ncbi:MAG: hypothetical protein JXB49_18355 [Bacteroidales bacterium]|nr:hypothetical protein [Bacteroidales bacterium]
MSIEVLEQKANGDIKVRIRWDNFNVNNDVRWCGPIKLYENIYLKPGHTISFDQGLTPTKPVNPIVFNGDKIFADPTVFTCKGGSYFKLESNSIVEVKNNSEFLMEPGSTLGINTGAVMDIKNTGKLTAHSGANINLIDSTSEIICRSGSVIDICSASITGSGKINDIWVNYIRSNLELNNSIIKSANVIELNNSSVGSNTNVELYAAEEITIDGTFEVPANSTFGAGIIQCPLNTN